jgi:uncharacterized protein YjbI with pentapeptide repeats
MKSTTDETRPRTPISADWVLKRIKEGKNVRLKNAIIEGDLDIKKLDIPTQNFYRTELQKEFGLKEDVRIVQSSIAMVNSEIQGNLDFSNATFKENTGFYGTTFGGMAWFNGANFKSANFERATFNEEVEFMYATFSGMTFFNFVTFSKAAKFFYTTFREVVFSGATFCGIAGFVHATFKEIWFSNATFKGNAGFYGATFNGMALFDNTTFKGNAGFNSAKFEGDFMTFRDATFFAAKSQEEACRRAKNVLAKAGNRDDEEYHFYREMEAKRKQKGIFETNNIKVIYSAPKKHQNLRTENLYIVKRFLWYDIIEHVFMQGIFGYGVHPKRLMISWGAIVLAFGFFYWYGDGIIGTTDWLDYIKVSFATAIAPGYIAAIINPGSAGYRLVPAYQIVAMIETIVGTFLWAGFIATFAKKYMR